MLVLDLMMSFSIVAVEKIDSKILDIMDLIQELLKFKSNSDLQRSQLVAAKEQESCHKTRKVFDILPLH